MRFAFKTTYDHDLGLFRDPVQRRWYAGLLAAVLLLPLAVPDYVSDISMVFIYGLCGLSLMVLAGYTGLVSLGHAAFLGIGAYAHVYFLQDLGLPWVVSVALAGVLSAAAGMLVGLPALRMTGVYLTIATLAFALIIQEVFTRWEHVTHGLKGRPVDKPVIFGVSLASDAAFYFLCLAVLMGGLWLTANVLRAPTGRAWVAIRDSEIAAQSMGVHLARCKTLAFAYSAGLMGAAGALFAHKIGFLAPDIFSVLLSIQFLLMVVVGGLGSLHGALYGAVFVAMLPVLWLIGVLPLIGYGIDPMSILVPFLVFAIGVSSVYSYLARPVLIAKSEGIPTIEIGMQHTELSDVVDFRFRATPTRALELIWEVYQRLGRISREKLRSE